MARSVVIRVLFRGQACQASTKAPQQRLESQVASWSLLGTLHKGGNLQLLVNLDQTCTATSQSTTCPSQSSARAPSSATIIPLANSGAAELSLALRRKAFSSFKRETIAPLQVRQGSGCTSHFQQRPNSNLLRSFQTRATPLDAPLSREKRFIEREARRKARQRATAAVAETKDSLESDAARRVAEPPGITQPLQGALRPRSPEEEALVSLLARPDLIITRNLELANIALGFEQESKFVIMDPREPSSSVGYILEESNMILRQLLRTHRPFKASVLDAAGNEICTIRRPFYWINSTIYVEVNGKPIGEAHRRWHLWKRNYDTYVGKEQFAAVENWGFWWWTFELKDEEGNLLAVIDRNWRGFGYELLTDAGQYCVRFGDVTGGDKLSEASVHKELEEKVAGHSGLLKPVAPSPQEGQVDVKRPLTLSERAVALALAVSLDCDYFSRSRGGFFPFPMFGEEFQDREQGGVPAGAAAAEQAAGVNQTEGSAEPSAQVDRSRSGDLVDPWDPIPGQHREFEDDDEGDDGDGPDVSDSWGWSDFYDGDGGG